MKRTRGFAAPTGCEKDSGFAAPIGGEEDSGFAVAEQTDKKRFCVKWVH